MGLFKKTVEGQYQQDSFKVTNTWFGGLKLYQNDELIKHNLSLFAIDKNTPVISEHIMVNGEERLVEVYVYAITTVRIQLRIDGEKIAGDDFNINLQ